MLAAQLIGANTFMIGTGLIATLLPEDAASLTWYVVSCGAFLAVAYMLVGARIARGLSQQDLAAQLGVDPSHVSRDERNDYRGVTVDRAQRVIGTLGVRFTAEAESLLVDDDAEYA